jgi:hypothetical protein
MTDQLEFEFGPQLVTLDEAARILRVRKRVLLFLLAMGGFPTHTDVKGEQRALLEEVIRAVGSFTARGSYE